MKAYNRKYLLEVVTLFVVYFITARIGLSINAVSGFAAAVWPPTGIALAATFLLGYRIWPGILLAALLVNLVTGAPLPVALGIGIGNTLEALLGTYLLRYFVEFKPSLERVKDVLGLVLYAALLSTCVSATIGVISLLLGGIIHTDSITTTWFAWWVGDALGVLVTAPLFFVWSSRTRFSLSLRRTLEALVVAVLLFDISGFIFRGLLQNDIKPITFGYLLYPILIWIVLSFRQRGSVTAIFGMSIIAIWSTVAGSSPYVSGTLGNNLLLLQSFTAVTAITFMTLASAVAERERTLKHKHRLEARTAVLVKQRSRLEALNKSKDEFISIASHQLRTPATAVKQYVGMLLENYFGKLTKDQRSMLDTAYANNELQLKVINELLSVTQVDTGKITINKEEVNLTDFINDVLRRQAAVFSARNQEVSFTPSTSDQVASVDKVKLGMVLENILDNASKYTPSGKKIAVAMNRNKTNFIISVKDEGMGINPKDQGKLFKKFSRIHNDLSTEAGGTGLGLYWAKKIVDAQGGSITVDSKIGHGSTFIMTVPLKK